MDARFVPNSKIWPTFRDGFIVASLFIVNACLINNRGSELIPPKIVIFINYISKINVEENIKLLPEIEIKRANNINHSVRKKEFLVGRIILYNYLKNNGFLDPHIIVDNDGKPFSLSVPSFNLSHSGDIVILALQLAGTPLEIGIDIEYVKRKIDYMAISKRFFTSSEVSLLHNDDNRVTCFFQLWTMKEAYLKAYGYGLRKTFLDIDFLTPLNSCHRIVHPSPNNFLEDLVNMKRGSKFAPFFELNWSFSLEKIFIDSEYAAALSLVGPSEAVESARVEIKKAGHENDRLF